MEGRYLLGLTTPEETRRFLRRHAGTDCAPPDLEARADAASRLRQARPPLAELPGPEEPPADWADHLQGVAARPLLRRLFGDGGWRFAAAPIASLISVQPHVNFAHAQRVAAACTTPAAVLELCLPQRPEALQLWGGVTEGEPPGATFYTRDPNVRVTEVRMETDPQLRVTFTISKTAVFVQVARLHGRLYLKNGTHRVVGLAARGLTHVPCVLVEAADVGALPGLLPPGVLLGPTPPLVTEFLDPRFHVPHPWPERVKFIRIVPEEFAAGLPD